MSRTALLATPGRVPYGAAYEGMHELADRRVANEIPDTLVLLEHPPVYTLGRRADPSHVLFDESRLAEMGAEVHAVDRGGSVTFHGPGQLVGYPVVDLGPAADVIRYLRMIEETIIRACADLGVEAGRSDRYTGVWAGDRKVCAIGVKVTRGVTLHGFALNCETDLSWFGAIVPCGLADRGVTSLTELAGRAVGIDDALPVVARRFEEVFGRRLEAAPPEIVDAFPAQSDRTASIPA